MSLPTKAVNFSNSHSESNFIDLICDRLLHITSLRKTHFLLIFSGSTVIPREVKNAVIIEMKDLTTAHEVNLTNF